MSTTIIRSVPAAWDRVKVQPLGDTEWNRMLDERYESRLTEDELRDLLFMADSAGFTDAALSRLLHDKVECDNPEQLTYAQYTRIAAWINGAIAHLYNKLTKEVVL